MTHDHNPPEFDSLDHGDTQEWETADVDQSHVSPMTHSPLHDHHDLDNRGQEVGGTEHRDIVGTPDADAQHWEHQTTNFSCAVEAQHGIIEALTGEDVSEAQLCTEAAERGWLTSAGGTSFEDTGKLLELHGVQTHCEMDATLGDVCQELTLGHKVIVGVKAEDLWDPGNPFRDFIGQGANHAIWVTGIDKSDPNDVKVIINDSGDPAGAGKEYHLNQFMDAWEDSGYFYLATDKAPPDLHGYAPDFDQDQGVFPAIVDWLHDHMPDSQTLLADMMILTGVMDISSRFRGEQAPRPAQRSVNASRSKPADQSESDSSKRIPERESGSSAPEDQKPSQGSSGRGEKSREMGGEESTVPPSKKHSNSSQDVPEGKPAPALADAVRDKVLDNRRTRESRRRSSLQAAANRGHGPETESSRPVNAEQDLKAQRYAPGTAPKDQGECEAGGSDAEGTGSNVVFIKQR